MSLERVAITGAAAGIGQALLLAASERGARTLGVDMDPAAIAATEELLAARGLRAELRRADLAEPDGVATAAEAMAAFGPLDLVALNAGINAVGRFEDSGPAVSARLLAVNLRAPIALASRLVASRALAPGGTLVFVASLSCFVGYPGAAVYAASKDGLASYARSLRAALGPSGIHVLTVFPGPTRTEHARRHSPPGADEGRRMPPEELARRTLRAVERRRRVLVPGASNRAFALLGRFLPGLAERGMKRAILDRLSPSS